MIPPRAWTYVSPEIKSLTCFTSSLPFGTRKGDSRTAGKTRARNLRNLDGKNLPSELIDVRDTRYCSLYFIYLPCGAEKTHDIVLSSPGIEPRTCVSIAEY